MFPQQHHDKTAYPSLFTSRFFATGMASPRPVLADERVNAERYLDKYLDYTEQQKPYVSLLAQETESG
jgi:hypothetical protein